jgi:hypothetical protein
MRDEDRLPLTEADLELIEQMRSWLIDRGMLTHLPFQARLLIELEVPLLVAQIRALRTSPPA